MTMLRSIVCKWRDVRRDVFVVFIIQATGTTGDLLWKYTNGAPGDSELKVNAEQRDSSCTPQPASNF